MKHMDNTEHTGESDSPNEKRRLNYKQIELFGKTGLSVEDMAAILNISVERVQRLMGREKTKFFQCYRRGQALTRFNLLQRQIATALGEAKGNPALLTHLGAVILGQQPIAKKPLSEEQEESVEKLIQNVSSSDKAQMYNVLIGNTEQEVGINDNE
jgi:predicted HTH domain antitoxin